MTAQHLPSAPHRLDIDGLRALAVIPVIFFHVGFTKFVGGFVGVDVFFVISGYLITRIINRELQQGRFSLAEFYRRRVLRIFPALFAMFAVTTIIASFFLLPLELVRYCESLISAAGFGSNIYFNFQPSGYFNGESATKGLLHTWSLSVEEQFYLFWPVILAVAHAKSFNRVRQISIFIIAISFAYSVWLVSTGSTSGFFLIPSRAWELMIGALIAVIPAARNENRWLREILSVSGILAILYCVRRYTSGTDFPGLAALAPCLGAAAIIYAGGSGTSLGAKFLSLRPIVFIGKISFSLYLWHWPVIFFVEVGLMRQQTLPIQLGEIFASLVLGYVSWRYVEQPFRTGVPGTSTKKVLSSAVVLMAITSVVGVAGILSNGLPDRFSKNQQAMAKFESIDGNRLFRSGSCFIISLHE
jgi:peptidoglycan/LPS O-acetylase OafA/YrhL